MNQAECCSFEQIRNLLTVKKRPVKSVQPMALAAVSHLMGEQMPDARKNHRIIELSFAEDYCEWFLVDFSHEVPGNVLIKAFFWGGTETSEEAVIAYFQKLPDALLADQISREQLPELFCRRIKFAADQIDTSKQVSGNIKMVFPAVVTLNCSAGEFQIADGTSVLPVDRFFVFSETVDRITIKLEHPLVSEQRSLDFEQKQAAFDIVIDNSLRLDFKLLDAVEAKALLNSRSAIGNCSKSAVSMKRQKSLYYRLIENLAPLVRPFVFSNLLVTAVFFPGYYWGNGGKLAGLGYSGWLTLALVVCASLLPLILFGDQGRKRLTLRNALNLMFAGVWLAGFNFFFVWLSFSLNEELGKYSSPLIWLAGTVAAPGLAVFFLYYLFYDVYKLLRAAVSLHVDEKADGRNHVVASTENFRLLRTCKNCSARFEYVYKKRFEATGIDDISAIEALKDKENLEAVRLKVTQACPVCGFIEFEAVCHELKIAYGMPLFTSLSLPLMILLFSLFGAVSSAFFSYAALLMLFIGVIVCYLLLERIKILGPKFAVNRSTKALKSDELRIISCGIKKTYLPGKNVAVTQKMAALLFVFALTAFLASLAMIWQMSSVYWPHLRNVTAFVESLALVIALIGVARFSHSEAAN